jgi:acetyl-CoA carboxylase biotin carboxyl carrier protein
MQVDEIRRLVKLVEESQIDELEVRRWWTVVRIHKQAANHKQEATHLVVTPAPMPMPVPVVAPVPVAAPVPAAAAAASPAAPAGEGARSGGASPAAVGEESREEELGVIRSPMVGTFYRAPSPTSPNYVEEGSSVSKGQVVCIVEAMKLMNEIEAEIAGTVVKILVQNGAPVEFNQPLFEIRP